LPSDLEHKSPAVFGRPLRRGPHLVQMVLIVARKTRRIRHLVDGLEVHAHTAVFFVETTEVRRESSIGQQIQIILLQLGVQKRRDLVLSKHPVVFR